MSLGRSRPMSRRRARRYHIVPSASAMAMAMASILLMYFLLLWRQLLLITEEKKGAFSNQDKIMGRTKNVQMPAQRLQQDQVRVSYSRKKVQTDDVNKKALQDTQKLLRERHIKLRHPILPKKLITVVGPESSGSTFLAATIASAVGADPKQVNKKARSQDGKTDVQHLSLPWGWFCEDNSSADDAEMGVHVVDAMVPFECFRYKFAPSLDPSIAQAEDIMSQKQVKVARDGPQTEVEAQLLQQCREEVFISQHSNSSCGAKCGTGVFSGYALYPKRFSVNITSQIEWYLQRGVDVTVILSTRDRSISVKGKVKNHCNIEKFLRREDEVAIELMNEALEKYGKFGSIKRGLVIVSSYEALMSMKDEYLFGLYKQIGINSTYVPSFSDGNKKYVTDANEWNMDKSNSSTAEQDISVQQPKSEAKDVNPKDLVLPKTLITVVGLEGSGSTFLSTTLSKVVSTDDDSRLQHISLPQGCVSERNATTTTVDALVPELALHPGRFYVNITNHIQWYLTRGVDVKVVLVLRDKTISKKEKLRNHHCRIPEVADVEDDAAMKIMREAYQKYGDERVMIVSYEGLMQFKQPYLFEIYESLGIEATYVPSFIDGNRKYVDSSSSIKENKKEEVITEGGIPVIHIGAKATVGTPPRNNHLQSDLAMLKQAEIIIEQEKSLAGHRHHTSRECQVPAEAADTFPWKYYDSLIDTNRKIGALARSIKEYIPKRDSASQKEQSRIPHRLIFTNKFNLLDCNLSSSITSDPSDHTLAHNVQDTINLYKKEWATEDVEVTFLTDKECVEAISEVEPELLKYYDGLEGMFKGDVCRVAYLYKNGGYYFDLDLVVVHPFIANAVNEFVTVKNAMYESDPRFFQAFLAVAPKNEIIKRSLDVTVQMLSGERAYRGNGNLGTQSLQDAWAELAREDPSIASTGRNKEVYLLSELIYDKRFGSIPKQQQENFGPPLFSSGACDFIVADKEEKSFYFYSHLAGTKRCGKLNQLHGNYHEEG